MTALLSIPVASAEKVLAVPLAAVFTEKGERYVFVKKDEKDDKFERRPVLVGIADYTFAEVQDGLAAGDIVSLEQPLEFRTSTSTNSLSGTVGLGGAGNPVGAVRGTGKAESAGRRAAGT